VPVAQAHPQPLIVLVQGIQLAVFIEIAHTDIGVVDTTLRPQQ
jgi:hypothetical protein